MMPKIKRVGKYGPRCSTRFKDRRIEMLMSDYEPVLLPRWIIAEWRERELAWMRGR